MNGRGAIPVHSLFYIMMGVMNNQQWCWEELTPDNIGEVFALIATVERADSAPIRTARQEVESYFGESLPWKAQGARCLDSNALIAFGFVRADYLSGESVITISGGVHPDWRRQGLGSELLERQVDLAGVLAQEINLSEYTVKMYIDERQHDLADLVRSTKFVHEYSFVQAQKIINPDFPQNDIGKYLQIKPLSAEYYLPVYASHLQAVNPDQKYENVQESDIDFAALGYVPQWCFVAVDTFGDRPELAGYILCSRFTTSGANQADEEGYIEELAVFPKWYRRGLEEALIDYALQKFFTDGIQIAGVDLIQKPDGSEKEINQKIRAAGFRRVSKTVVVSTKVQLP
ncbi:hypothetical protein RQN30_00440 [Arcanobacterium hippocoleae]